MRFKFIVILFLFSYMLSFGVVKNPDEINTLKITIDEVAHINKNKETKYLLTIKKPNTVKKEITFPELNKGEIYIYTGEKKIIYLPFFNQVTEEKITSDENEIVEAINFLLDMKDKNMREKYQNKKLKEIILNNGNRIKIENIKEIDGYLLPFKFVIYDNDVKIATLNIKDYKINSSITDEEFKVK